MKRTKIICTIGPASQDVRTLQQMMRAGMNVARLNFSHGTFAAYRAMIRSIRQAEKATHNSIAILQDLQGPRFRLGKFENPITIRKGQEIIFLPPSDFRHARHASAVLLPLAAPMLMKALHAGDHVLMKDGTIDVVIEQKRGTHLIGHTVQGGSLVSHQALNAPGVRLEQSSITVKDRRDVAFGLRHGIDAVALSFIKDERDVRALRRLVPKGIKIVAKIERREALEHFSRILRETDMVMVARGDLGVELPPEDVPLAQKELTQQCLAAGKPVIIATQMLESMIETSRPTRAEAADVANAVIDHADALMLSGETAHGQHPVESVRMMQHIIREVESSRYDDLVWEELPHSRMSATQSVAHAAVALAESIDAAHVVTFTETGLNTPFIAQRRPQKTEIIVLSTNARVVRQMSMVWGVRAFRVSRAPANLDGLRRIARTVLLRTGIAKKGESAVLVWKLDQRRLRPSADIRQVII